MTQIGADVGGVPTAYPVRYELVRLLDGVVLKITDDLDCRAEIVMTSAEAHVLGAQITHAACGGETVVGMVGAPLDHPGGHPSNGRHPLARHGDPA